MSSITWLIILFLLLIFVSIAVYVAVVRAYYWGDKNEPPTKKD